MPLRAHADGSGRDRRTCGSRSRPLLVGGGAGPTPDVSIVLTEGPWTHRMVAANGARFHVAEAGPAGSPLVLLLHGFPQFWWSWRHQIPQLAAAGHRVAAMDLRGYGASDKPPHGHDAVTLAGDVAAVVRSLGASEAVVVGHGLGGWLAWCLPALHPEITRAVASVSMPHPLVVSRASWSSPGQVVAHRELWQMQLPVVPERHLLTRPRYVEQVMRRWSGSADWPPTDLAQHYTDALALPFVGHSAVEQHRWLVRSVARPSGRRLVTRLRRPVGVPALLLRGARDRCIVPAATPGTRDRCVGPYEEHTLDDVGHFLHEQDPQRTGELLVRWLATLP